MLASCLILILTRLCLLEDGREALGVSSETKDTMAAFSALVPTAGYGLVGVAWGINIKRSNSCIVFLAKRQEYIFAISMDSKQPMIANPKSAMQIWDFPSNFPYNLFTLGLNLHIPCQAPKKTLSASWIAAMLIFDWGSC